MREYPGPGYSRTFHFCRLAHYLFETKTCKNIQGRDILARFIFVARPITCLKRKLARISRAGIFSHVFFFVARFITCSKQKRARISRAGIFSHVSFYVREYPGPGYSRTFSFLSPDPLAVRSENVREYPVPGYSRTFSFLGKIDFVTQARISRTWIFSRVFILSSTPIRKETCENILGWDILARLHF